MLDQRSDLRFRSYQFSLQLIDFCNTLPNQRASWVMGDQVLRCGTSIGANIFEAKASSSKRDFIKFYDIALKSANETEYWLCLIRDSAIAVNKKVVNQLLLEVQELSRMLGKSLITLKRKK